MWPKRCLVPTKVWETEPALKVLCKCDSEVWTPVAGVNETELLVPSRAGPLKEVE